MYYFCVIIYRAMYGCHINYIPGSNRNHLFWIYTATMLYHIIPELPFNKGNYVMAADNLVCKLY